MLKLQGYATTRSSGSVLNLQNIIHWKHSNSLQFFKSFIAFCLPFPGRAQRVCIPMPTLSIPWDGANSRKNECKLCVLSILAQAEVHLTSTLWGCGKDATSFFGSPPPESQEESFMNTPTTLPYFLLFLLSLQDRQPEDSNSNSRQMTGTRFNNENVSHNEHLHTHHHRIPIKPQLFIIFQTTWSHRKLYLSANELHPHFISNIHYLRRLVHSAGWHVSSMDQTWVQEREIKIYTLNVWVGKR